MLYRAVGMLSWQLAGLYRAVVSALADSWRCFGGQLSVLWRAVGGAFVGGWQGFGGQLAVLWLAVGMLSWAAGGALADSWL